MIDVTDAVILGLVVLAFLAIVAALAVLRLCPVCREERTACLVGCDDVSRRLDQLQHEQVEVVTTFTDLGEAIDFVALAQTAQGNPYFYRCRNGVAEVCRVVTVNG